MKFLFLIISTNLISVCFCQKTDTIYFDKNWNVSSKEQAKYYRLLQLNDDKTISVADYFKSTGQIQMRGTFNSLNDEKKIGNFEYYYKNGNIKSEGSYDSNGKKTGLWKIYLNNNWMCCKFNYMKGQKNGIGNTYYKNGNLKLSANFKDDIIFDWKKKYWRNGNLKIEKYYNNGTYTGNYNKYSKKGERTKSVIFE